MSSFDKRERDFMALGFFDKHEAEYRKTNPEWFETEDVQEEYNEIGSELTYRY